MSAGRGVCGEKDSRVVLPDLGRLVRERLLGRDDTLGEANVDDVGFVVNFLCAKTRSVWAQRHMRRRGAHPKDRERQSLNVGPKTTEVGTEETGEHVHALVDEVDRGSARRGLGVHRVVRVDEVRDVGNVYEKSCEPQASQICVI